MRSARVRASVWSTKEVKMSTTISAPPWEYLVVPLPEAKGLKKSDEPWKPDVLDELGTQGWEAVGLSLKYGDLMAWPVVLLKRPRD
jgi:hypothetical protein